MSEKKIWVETIIDAFDLETTKEIARKAVEFGTDWISVGTNNMYACGFMHSIPAVKEIAGDIPVVADIKMAAMDFPYRLKNAVRITAWSVPGLITAAPGRQ